jgi:hypothetical protein
MHEIELIPGHWVARLQNRIPIAWSEDLHRLLELVAAMRHSADEVVIEQVQPDDEVGSFGGIELATR